MEDHGQLEVGHHDARTCPNCIVESALKKLSEGDLFAIKWCGRNATGFVKDFGMMPSLIERLGMNEASKELFLMKLNLIYKNAQNCSLEEMKNE